MKLIFPVGLVLLLFLAACGGPTASQPAAESSNPLEMTVFRSPT